MRAPRDEIQLKLPRPYRESARFRLTADVVVHLLLICMLIFATYIQEATGSRKFLTGLIIGTLLARNGMQGGQPYSAPAGYSPQAPHQQQPLFIIIPSSGKSNYRTKPHIYSPPPSYDYGHAQYGHHRAAAAARRLSPYLRRRSGPLLARRQPTYAPELAPMNEPPSAGSELETVGEELLDPRQKAIGLKQAIEDPKLGWLTQHRYKQQDSTDSSLGRLRASSKRPGLPSSSKLARWPVLTRPEHKLVVDIGERPRALARASEVGGESADLEMSSRPARPSQSFGLEEASLGLDRRAHRRPGVVIDDASLSPARLLGAV